MSSMKESLFLAVEDLPWRDSPHAGVRWKKLFHDPVGGDSAVILCFDPGAAYGAHRHPAGEEYLVLEGTLDDGDRSYGAGTYVRHPPGSVHRPSSRDGCLLYVRLPRPIEPVVSRGGDRGTAAEEAPKDGS